MLKRQPACFGNSRPELWGADTVEPLKEIDHTLTGEYPSLRTRIFVQNLANTHHPKGTTWHIDTSNDELEAFTPFPFLFGYSSHRTHYVAGEIDFTAAADQAREFFEEIHGGDIIADMANPVPWLLGIPYANTDQCVKEAIKSKKAKIFTFAPGTVLDIPAGSVHEAKPVNYPIDITVPRLAIEHYFD
jgi:hypothetical protein